MNNNDKYITITDSIPAVLTVNQQWKKEDFSRRPFYSIRKLGLIINFWIGGYQKGLFSLLKQLITF